MRKSDVIWKCVPECWIGVSERAFTVGLSVDRQNAECMDIWRLELPRGCVNLEQIERQIRQDSRSDSNKTIRTKLVFDSSIDWKPVQSVKMRCSVVCLRSFQDEVGYIVLNLLKSVKEELRVSRKEGIAIVQSWEEQKLKQAFWWLKQKGNGILSWFHHSKDTERLCLESKGACFLPVNIH